jgi:uncharacterized protein (TIGR03083 family)
VESQDLLQIAEKDGMALLAAAQTRWDRPVPHCPDWDAAGLVRHMGSIFGWMAAVVTTGERVSRRSLEPAPPEDPHSLPAWYLAALSRAIQVLGSADPEAATWTFSRIGDQRAGWWCRRLADEVAVHRWDAEHAVADEDQGGAAAQSIDGAVAAAGIEEFLVEFLPGLLAQEDVEGFTGTLHLAATDGPAQWRIDLDDDGKVISERADAGAEAEAEADTTVRGTRSDLLLWLNNRGPLETLEVSGDEKILDRWGQLSF